MRLEAGKSAPLALGLGGRTGDALDSSLEAALAGLVVIVVAEAAKLALVATVTGAAQLVLPGGLHVYHDRQYDGSDTKDKPLGRDEAAN